MRGQSRMAKNGSPLESVEQETIFNWTRARQTDVPQLELAYGTMNGVRVNPGLRGKMKKQGNKSGVPDIVIPAWSADKKHPGLYIELKRRQGGKVSDEQKRYMQLLANEGYMACVCHGSDEAICTICEYFGVSRLSRHEVTFKPGLKQPKWSL